jgi:hypothetical protein
MITSDDKKCLQFAVTREKNGLSFSVTELRSSEGSTVGLVQNRIKKTVLN